MSLDVYIIENDETVWDYNITHNLNKMAKQVGLYEALWRPDENGFETTTDIVEFLEGGFVNLKDKPDYYKQFNPENGWGKYEDLVKFVEQYLEACKDYPNCEIYTSR